MGWKYVKNKTLAEITVKITISESVYKDWSDYEVDGIAMVKQNLQKDFREACNKLGINDFEIEVDVNNV